MKRMIEQRQASRGVHTMSPSRRGTRPGATTPGGRPGTPLG
jgi:hypothetical protein